MTVLCQGHVRAFQTHWLLRVFIVLAVLSWQSLAWSSVDSGKAWLTSQIAASGAVTGQNNSLALPTQVQSEVAHTLNALGQTVPAALLQQIQQSPQATTEYLARYQLTSELQGNLNTSYLADLASLQNEDGGFGAAEGYASNPLDTAWALLALQATGQTITPTTEEAVAWLLNTQRADGSWFITADEDGIVPTALAVQALQHYRSYSGVSAAQGRARTWLDGQKQSNQSWGRADHTAQALLALLPAQTNASAYASSVAYLESAQQANGSWLNDPYVTALVLRALWLAGQPIANPDLASITGVIIAEDTGLPVEGVAVSLLTNGISAITDSQGRFAFAPVQPGTEQLRVQATGYLALSAQLTIPRGELVDLGNLLLKPVTATNATTVTIAGTARYTDDGVNYQSAGNATISIGAQSTRTNANGEYTLTGIAPGLINLEARYSNYRPVDISFTGEAGQLVRFDPSFVRGGVQNTLYVVVTDQVTGDPVDFASVNLNGIVRSVNPSGEVNFYTGVEVGVNTVTVNAAGYDTRIISMDVQGQQNIVLPVTLSQTTTAPGQTALSGTITDAATSLPLQGAAVRISGTSHLSITDLQGKYVISGAPDFSGNREVVVEHAGYQTHTQTVSISSGRSHAFDIPLRAIPDANQSTLLELSVVDQVTSQPIANANITLSGSNPHVAQTDASGQVRIGGVSPGLTQVQVGASGYDNAVFSIDLQQGIRYRVPVQLEPQVLGTERIHGRVIDSVSRRPIPGARVTLTGSSVLQSVADANGRYEFAGIALGRWNLSATATGYAGSSKGYDFSASSEVDIALRLGGSGSAGTGTLRTIAVGHPNNATSAVGYLFVFGPQGTQGNVSSNDGVMNTDFTIDATGVAEIMVPSAQFLYQTGRLLDKAMLVHANNPVSAYFLNRQQYSTDMTYLLDASALGTSYRILNWNHALGMLQMSFTALEDGTTVRVTPTTVLNSGQPAVAHFDVHLNKGQSYIYTASNGNDMTGTTLESNRPLAVFTGSQCSNVPTSSGYCDHLFTQLPPIEHWDSEYIIPKSANTGTVGNLVRVLSDRDNNTITINGVNVAVLNSGEFHQIDRAEDLHIKSTHPVLVGQFLKGSSVTTGGRLGDPAFTYLPGIRQTLSSYMFTAPTNLAAYQQNYVNVAILSSALPSLRLNGAAVDTSDFRPIAGGLYSAGNIPVPTGAGEIHASIPFLASLSGFNRYDSYHSLIGANYSSGASTVDPVIVAIDVASDQAVYPTQTAALMTALITNQGVSAAELTVALHINDANGILIHQFASHDLGPVQPGQSITQQEPWNTATYPAGTYTLIGTLRDQDGNVVGVASTLFAITAGATLDAPSGALTVATDKAIYRPDDRVRIDNLVRNLTQNAHIDDARVELSVRDPGNAVIFTHSIDLGQISAGSVRSLHTLQPLKNAPLGEYTVTAVLFGSGHNIKNARSGTVGSATDSTTVASTKAYRTNVQLATASTRYQVDLRADPNPGTGTNPGPNADYAISKNALTPVAGVGEQAVWEIVVTNNGPQDGHGVLVEDRLPTGLTNISWRCEATGQAACGTRSGTGDIVLDAIVHTGRDDRITIVVTGQTQATGALTNTASLSAIGGGVDTDSSNNTSTAQVVVGAGTGPNPNPAASSADYTIDKTALTNVAVGERAQWQLIVTNSGPDAGDGVRVQDILPTGLTAPRWSCQAFGQATCPQGGTQTSGSGALNHTAQVSPGATNRLVFTVSGLTQAEGVLANTAIVSATGRTTDPNSANNSSSASLNVLAAGTIPQQVTPVPINQPWLIALLALLLTGCTGQRRQRQHHKKPRQD